MAKKKSKRKPKKKYNLKSNITSALRKVWQWHPGRTEAMKRAESGEHYVKIAKKSKKEYKAPYYKCEYCGVKTEKIKVDHIETVVDLTGFEDWNTYINRLFVPADKLRCWCKDCHDAVTLVQTQVRKKLKQKLK
jgi:hypothetical protein